MKKHYLKLLLLFIITLPWTVSCGCQKVRAGNVGVKVYLLGKKKGVDHEVLGVGKYYIGINEELYKFPTFQQNYVWTADKKEGSPNDESITFQTAEGMSCGADVGISYHLNPEKISAIFQKYRKGIDEITDVYMRNHVRDAFNSIASKYKVESVYGKGKTDLLKQVNVDIKRVLTPQGIIVDKIYLIGSIRLPKTVVKALNLKIEATQKAQQRQNEVEEAKAQALKKIAQADGEAKSILKKAEAQAKANRLLNASLTSTLVKYKSIEKWDGKLPQISGGNSIPMIDLKTTK